MTDSIPLFPVASITTGPVPSLDLVTIRFDFLTHSMQRPEEANLGRHYALTPSQARELAAQMEKALRILETASSQGKAGPTH